MSRVYWAYAVASNHRSRASGLSRRSSSPRTITVAGLFWTNFSTTSPNMVAGASRNLHNIGMLQDIVNTLKELV